MIQEPIMPIKQQVPKCLWPEAGVGVGVRGTLQPDSAHTPPSVMAPQWGVHSRRWPRCTRGSWKQPISGQEMRQRPGGGRQDPAFSIVWFAFVINEKAFRMEPVELELSRKPENERALGSWVSSLPASPVGTGWGRPPREPGTDDHLPKPGLRQGPPHPSRGRPRRGGRKAPGPPLSPFPSHRRQRQSLRWGHLKLLSMAAMSPGTLGQGDHPSWR